MVHGDHPWQEIAVDDPGAIFGDHHWHDSSIASYEVHDYTVLIEAHLKLKYFSRRIIEGVLRLKEFSSGLYVEMCLLRVKVILLAVLIGYARAQTRCKLFLV